jgi:hypothetical protein
MNTTKEREMTYRSDIKNAKTLDELCEALNRACETHDDPDEKQTIEDRIQGVDMADLPTFGGPEPRNTDGIYSWDETRILYARSGLTPPAWGIQERDEE